jgi:hypothetical protein
MYLYVINDMTLILKAFVADNLEYKLWDIFSHDIGSRGFRREKVKTAHMYVANAFLYIFVHILNIL